jgi:hypothetical protein
MRWTHAFEEDDARGAVYRPSTDDFPLSRRPRRSLVLHEDGSAQVWIPGPGDRPVAMKAAWRRDGDAFLVEWAHGDAERHEWRVSVLSPSRLLVRM